MLIGEVNNGDLQLTITPVICICAVGENKIEPTGEYYANLTHAYRTKAGFKPAPI